MVSMLVGCYNAADKPVIEDTLPVANCTMAEFRRIVGSGADKIGEPITLRGRITSSDEEDNFYGSLIVEDATGAVEVMVGYPTLHALYPEGLEVALAIEGCSAAPTRGIVQIGRKAAPSSYYAVDYLESRERVDEVIRRGLSVERVAPKNIEIGAMGIDLCGRLATVDSLRLVASTSIDTLTMTLDDAVWRGTALFTDPRGDTLAIFTRDYADFADRAIPSALQSATGIVEQNRQGSRPAYNLRMRYESDAVGY